MAEITGVGVYLPLLRLDRAAAVAALKWSGLPGARAGHRGVAAWDEDAVTLAVEAGRALAAGRGGFDEVTFASTSAPFFDRLHAGLVVDALHLSPVCSAADVSGTRRCAVSALARALRSSSSALIVAGEKRPTTAGSASQLAWGDGAAAVAVGPDGFARLRGFASLSHDLIDVYCSREHPAPYVAEERFVRETAIGAVLAPTIRGALENAEIPASRINYAVVPEPVPGAYKPLAASLALQCENLAETVQQCVGDLGAAHSLFALALAFEKAKTGDFVLMAGFGSGCDALILEVTGEARAPRVTEALRRGLVLKDYTRFLSLSGCLDLDWGPRSELEQKTAAPVLERHGRDVLGFIGGRDSTGNVQFPKTRVPVSPEADRRSALADVRLADAPAKIQSITADRLNFSSDPPFYFGLVQFANGARVLMEFCDTPPGSLRVGDDVRMRFRIKSIDRRRGFRTYFWKACPAERPSMEN